MTEQQVVDLKDYKVLETRLYGELMKTCRRYTNDLNLISILGILEIVKQEITDLDKTSRSFTKQCESDFKDTSNEENKKII
ncbi:MAG: hypothetical protein QXS02_01600 [Candidatus Thermoplasmatota archaeon]